MKPIQYEGRWFASLKELHELRASDGVTYNSFYGRYRAEGPLKDVCYSVGGVTYQSLGEVAAAFGVKESLLASRMSRMTLDEALVYNPSNGRYTEKRFKQDPQLAEAQGYLYFLEITFPRVSLHKIGITQRNVESRFAGTPDFKIIALVEGHLGELFAIEQAIIKQFRSKRFRAENEFEGRTETFRLTNKEEDLLLKAIRESVATLGVRRARFIAGHS